MQLLQILSDEQSELDNFPRIEKQGKVAKLFVEMATSLRIVAFSVLHAYKFKEIKEFKYRPNVVF